MFQLQVNAGLNGACNNATFTLSTMVGMAEELHESAQRLYGAAKQLASAEGVVAIANLLNESPQVVTNWSRRGISERGALKAQAAIGVDANWLLTGQGGAYAGWQFPRVDPSRYLRLSPEDRAWVQSRLQQAIEECERGHPTADAAVLSRARGVLDTSGPAKKVKKRSGS